MSGLWTPPGVNVPSTMDVDSNVDLLDSEILKIEAGPLAWANERAGKSLEIDRFTKDLAEQFNQIGFKVEVQVWETNQPGAWAFKILIEKRIGKEFDPDQQVYEVVNNILDIPGQEKGFINTGKSMLDFEKQAKSNKKSQGGHFHGH